VTWGSAEHHQRHMDKAPNNRRKCHCGCGGRQTHIGKANGIALMWGCELHVRRWVKDWRNAHRAAAVARIHAAMIPSDAGAYPRCTASQPGEVPASGALATASESDAMGIPVALAIGPKLQT
jgi:hypothetical protein